MTTVKTESVYEETTPKKEIDTPISRAFNKVRSYTNPLLSYQLLRKRRKVTRVKE